MNRKTIRMFAPIAVLVLASLACGLGGGDDDVEPAAPTNTPPPTDVPDPAVELGGEFRSEEGGFAFNLVPGWQTDEFAGIVSHQPDGADDFSGPAIIMVGGLGGGGATLDQAYDDFVAEFTTGGVGEVALGAPFDTTINGAQARGVDITGTSPDGTRTAGQAVVVVVNEQQTLLAIGVAPAELWEQEVSGYFAAVLGTVSFFEPAADVGGDLGGVDDGGETFTEIRQWASGATASSEYTSDSWSALQATGAPDVYPDCGDFAGAWASSFSNTSEWLEVSYAIPVIPTEILVYETYNAGQIVAVDVRDLAGSLHTVYEASPAGAGGCSSVLSVFPSVDFEINSIVIYLDQSVVEDWAEIDAVELVGLATTTSAPPTEPVFGEAPEGFRWRYGGESGIDPGEFGAVGGMDVDLAGFLYIADNIHGIHIFNEAGELVDQIDHDIFNNPNDVSVSRAGDYIVVSAWGNNSVFVLDGAGNLLTQFGGEGNGPGQFGSFSPESVAIDLGNNIYVLDDNEDDSGEDFSRIQVFDISGNYLYEWRVEDDFFAANAIEYLPGATTAEDRIFVLGFIGGYIIEYDLEGNRLGSLGEDALDFTGPQDFAVDRDGYFYITTWTPDGVMKLDPQGNLVAQWGYSVEEGDVPWGEGGFYSPSGVAVSWDGVNVYANDWSGVLAYVTAFFFP